MALRLTVNNGVKTADKNTMVFKRGRFTAIIVRKSNHLLSVSFTNGNGEIVGFFANMNDFRNFIS